MRQQSTIIFNLDDNKYLYIILIQNFAGAAYAIFGRGSQGIGRF